MASVEIWVDKDTFIRSDASDYDFSGEPYAWTHSGSWNARTFLEFDISDGPAVATGVYLQLLMKGGDSHLGPQTIHFERLVEPIPDPCTWDDQPLATIQGRYSEAIPAFDEYEWFSFDITELYNDCIAAGDNTLGIRLRYETESLEDDYGRLARTKESGATSAASILVNYEEPPEPPTITNISWSPAGDFHKLPSGASLTGSTEDLYLIGTDPGAFADPGFSDGEALLRIGTGGDLFAVAEGDHFRFDDMEWWVLNIVCGPECSFITLADENAEAAREPKLGDEIQFSCNVDWHGETPDEVRWYYAKTPNRCFDEGDVSWTPFANEQYPLHVFEEDDDTDIVFIKAWARNAAGEIGELGDTCEPVFNLWAYHPSWWDSLLESIQSVNEEIASPITNLFAHSTLEGWTEPPFECPICEQVFKEEGSELEYAKHLMSHITAFEYNWFGK
jgi:hypothetical protein